MLKKTIGMLALAAALVSSARGEVATGAAAPNFTLTDITGAARSLADFKGKFIVLEWVNHGCPFVVKHYGSGNMQKLQEDYTAKGVIWLSICSSAEGKQGNYSPEEWVKLNAEKNGKATAVLLDPAGEVGKLYGAKTTPHLFVINPDGNLIYQGAIDDKPSTKADDIPFSKNFIRAALDEALAGKPVTIGQTKSYGCGVKYAN